MYVCTSCRTDSPTAHDVGIILTQWLAKTTVVLLNCFDAVSIPATGQADNGGILQLVGGKYGVRGRFSVTCSDLHKMPVVSLSVSN